MLAEASSTHPGLMDAPDLSVKPPPWSLNGDGWAVFFRFDAHNLPRRGPLIERPELAGRWRGGLGAILWADYRQSAVGPYRELIFIPGRFEVPLVSRTRKIHSISRIFVSTWDSVVSGRANWGIPKDRADFLIERRPDGTDHLAASVDGHTICEMVAKPGLFRLPLFSNRLLPFAVMQQWGGETLVTRLHVHAGLSWLDVQSLHCDDNYFPQPGLAKPLGAVKFDRGRMTFPEPKRYPGVEPVQP